MKMPVKERLLRQTTKTPTCWLWNGTIDYKGYGQISIKNKHEKCHRMAYQEFIGPLIKGLLICHSCDIRNCINPKHLWQGTNRDNIIDMYIKKRGPSHKGEKNGNSKLTLKVVNKIRDFHQSGEYKLIDLAKKFRTTHSTIENIIYKRRWN